MRLLSTIKRRTCFVLPSTLLLMAACLISPGKASAEHPEVLVTPADHDSMLAKMQNAPWASAAYKSMKANVDHYVTLCQSDPDFVTSRLFMNWQSHATQPIVEHDRYVRGDGHAPIPTPHFAGARDWATAYHMPDSIDDWRPYNDQDGKIWLLDTSNQGGWIDPSITGRIIEVSNSRIMRLAANASYIYWLTGDEKYAAFASHILMTYMDGFQYGQLPQDLGGPNTIIGYDSFEVIHEEIMPSLGIAYDFLHGYLVKQGDDVSMVQAQLKRMSDRVIDAGNPTGNWDLNQVNNFIEPALALEDDSAYPDHHGRQYYIDIILNARLVRQTGIVHIIKEGYDQKTALWPEAPGYAFGTTPQMILFSLLLGNTPQGKTLSQDPILPRALLAQLELIYPNGYSLGEGDTDNGRVRADGLELGIAAARQRGDKATELSLTSALDREIASGGYVRGKDADLIALTQYVGTLADAPPIENNLERSYFAAPVNTFVLRNPGSDPQHSLEAAIYGTGGGHVHSNGMSIELYGAGLIMGADPGRGASYWTKDHAEYYSQPPAHNTVIVNGKSNYAAYAKPQYSLDIQSAEPLSQSTAKSPDISYATCSFHYDAPNADQQRTLAVVRTSPTTGFYFDVFRSKSASDPSSFHDYLYHDIGQSLILTDSDSKSLPLAASTLLGTASGDLKGYDYFTNEQSAQYSGDIHGTFSMQMPDTSTHVMSVWMLGNDGHTVFSVDAPKDNAAREALPKSVQVLPMPTLIVRQQGDAWDKPFISVYEPYLGQDGPSIESVRQAKIDGDSNGIAACVVDGKTASGPYTATLIQSDNPAQSVSVEGMAFSGTFAVVVTKAGHVTELYLGSGSKLDTKGMSISSIDNTPIDASLYQDASGWHYSSSNPICLTLSQPLTSDFVRTVSAVSGERSGSSNDHDVQFKSAKYILPAGLNLSVSHQISSSVQGAEKGVKSD